MRDVSPSDLHEFVSALTVEKRKKVGKQIVISRLPASPQTRLHAKNALSAIFEHAILIEWLGSRNPAKSARLPEMQRKPAYALDVDQARVLLDVLRSPPREMSMAATLTSVNMAEMCKG